MPNDNWITPFAIYQNACQKFNVRPILDVCADHTNKKCQEHFNIRDNALSQEWRHDFFMNPPYSDIPVWMMHAVTQHKKHNVDALILVPASVDTLWWHDYVEDIAEVHFHKGRILFEDPITRKIDVTKRPRFASAWVIFRKTQE